jgi:cytochrome c556
MTSKRIAGIALLAAFLIVLGLQPGSATVQQKGKTRSATTKQLMRGLVAPNCGALKKALAAGDAEKATLYAALLNEAGHILMADGRCPSGDWKSGAETLQGCSKVILAKLKENDVEGAQSAFTALTKGCGACHSAHKKK